MAKQSDYVRYTIRVPADLYEHVARRADENGRSVNAEIIERLRTVQEMDAYVPERNAHPDDGLSDEALFELVMQMSLALQRRMKDR